MHILHILRELRPSGAERMLVHAAPHWLAAGIAGTVVATAREAGPYAPALAAAGFRIVHVPTSGIAGPWRLAAAIGRIRPDLVHVHLEPLFPITALAARLQRIPSARTLHAVFDYDGLLRRRQRFGRRIARLAGCRMVAPGAAVADNEADRLGNPCTILENWIGDGFRPALPAERASARAALGLAEGDIAVATVGNCSPVKDHGLLLEALAEPGLGRVVWIHVGLEDAGCGERRRADAIGLAARVRFLGARDDVRGILHGCDLFAMTSRSEGFGLALHEAAACGLPCIVADAPGLRSFPASQPCATVAGRDPRDFAAALRACIGRLDRLSGEAQRDAAGFGARFGSAAGAGRYTALWSGLVRS